jgi:hypothetical protein
VVEVRQPVPQAISRGMPMAASASRSNAAASIFPSGRVWSIMSTSAAERYSVVA